MKANLKIEAIGYNNNQMNKLVGRFFSLPSRFWVAEITGYDPKYKYTRVFLKYKVDYLEANSKLSRGVYVNYLLETGKVYEVSHPSSWKNTDRYFAVVTHTGEILRYKEYDSAKEAIKQKCIRSS